jgi:cytochrome P450
MLSITDPRYLDDRYGFYRRFHEKASVAWDEKARAFLVGSHDAVLEGFRSPKLSSRRIDAMTRDWSDDVTQALRPLTDHLSLWMLFQDPPDHTRLRAIMAKAFTARIVESMRPRVQVLVDELLDQASARGGAIDVIGDLAFPLPATVILEILGIPPADRDRFKVWSADIAQTLGSVSYMETGALAKQAVVEMRAYFAPLFADRRASPKDDLISGLIAATDRHDVVGDDELLANCVMLMFGGHETTTNLIGNGVVTLLEHPEERARWIADASLTASAVEELLRYEAPVQFMRRTTLEPIEIGGVALPTKAIVMLLIGAANRDPRAFPEPDRLDVARRPKHAAFGFGPHFCIGAALARVEAEVAILTLFRRFPELRLASTARPHWRPSPVFRALTSLDVVTR